MSSRASAGIDVVKREEKEIKLKQFIEDCLAIAVAAAARSSGDSALEASLVVRSATSPVARALASVMESHIETPISVKAVIANADVTEAAATAVPLDRLAAEVRILRDERLLNAHEQLVLGSSLTWVGDCMRRDPEKRDAYEFYGREADAAAAWARTSFDRLWAIAEPLTRAADTTAAEDMADGEGFDILVTPEPQPVVRASTRH